MASEQAQRYASVRERTSNPDLDLATRRDVDESLHAAAREPERVTYAEADAGGVPALWCIPEDSDAERVLLFNRAVGTVVSSMHSDRKAAGHLARAAGFPGLVLDYRRSPLKPMTWTGRFCGCWIRATGPRRSSAAVTRSAATLP